MEPLNTVLIEKLRDLFSQVPFSIDSWYRTPTRNQVVGGALNSYHTKGLAVDLIFDSVADLFRAGRLATQLGFGGVEIDLINNHLHLDLRVNIWHVVCTKVDGKRVELALAEYTPST